MTGDERPAQPGQPPRGEPPAGESQPPDAAALKAERDDLLDRLQRVSADYLNYQKRIRRQMEEAREYANAGLIADLIGVLDDMERALEAARENHDEDDPLLVGMRLVHAKALEVLGRYGLERIAAEGEPFDPNCHEAMMQEVSEAHDRPTVLRELQSGYALKGRVIRPARVVVSAPAGATRQGGEGPAAVEPGEG